MCTGQLVVDGIDLVILKFRAFFSLEQENSPKVPWYVDIADTFKIAQFHGHGHI